MPSVNLKVIFGEKEFDAPVIFKFKKHFQIKGDQLFCAEFDPPLTVQGTELKFVNFTDFTFQGFGFTLYAPDDFYYNFQDSDERFVMKIIEHGNIIIF